MPDDRGPAAQSGRIQRCATIVNRDLDHLRRVWETLGRDDPLWAVLSHPDKRGGRWDADEFFATGRFEVDAQLNALHPTGYPHERRVALDFGCGAGRLTRALGARFSRAIGLDVSATMIATARRLNSGVEGLTFRVNDSARLPGIPDASVDFVFSHITLQHIPVDLALGYVEEFLRVLAPGGVAVFQFVDEADDTLRGRLFGAASNRLLNPIRRIAWRRRDVFEMHALSESRLCVLLAARAHLRLLEATDDAAAGPGWRGRRWVVVNDEVEPISVERADHVLFVDPRDAPIGAPLIAGAEHDPHVARAVRAGLPRGGVFVDIGANIGSIALPAAAAVGPGGRVVAIEPVPRNARLLARSALASGFDHLDIIQAAASDRSGRLVLRTHASTSNSAVPAASGPLLRAMDSNEIEVPAVVLDERLAGLDRLDVVKIDVEGMEPLALRGMQRILERFHPLLVCEFHPWAIERATGVRALDHLEWLGRFYPVVEILRGDGTLERCADRQAVMSAWERTNAAAGSDGRVHLDLRLSAA